VAFYSPRRETVLGNPGSGGGKKEQGKRGGGGGRKSLSKV